MTVSDERVRGGILYFKVRFMDGSFILKYDIPGFRKLYFIRLLYIDSSIVFVDSYFACGGICLAACSDSNVTAAD